jgi:D-3-phosphoglycerate dehydrogenase
MTETIVILDPMTEKQVDRLRPYLPAGFVLTHGTERGDAHMKEIIADADYAISGQVGVSGDVLRAARKLKLLHKWGVGVDNLDVATARELGIKVARTTGANALAVAEFTIGLMLATLRNITLGHRDMQRGGWRSERAASGTFLLSNKTVGLVGFGAIGRTVARLLAGFRCTVFYNKRHPLERAEEETLGVRYATLPDLLRHADIVSLHCPFSPETSRLIDYAALKTMKRGAILVNVARGGVVVEDDLVRALREGVIHAAASDVFENEPLQAGSPLIGLDNMTTTPHLAAMTQETFVVGVTRMFDNIQRLSRGEEIPAQDLVV